MTDDTDTDLQARLERAEFELFTANSRSVVMATSEAIKAHVDYVNAKTVEIEGLRQQLAARAPKWQLAPIAGSRLSTGYIPKPERVQSDYRPQDYSPIQRFAEEMGWTVDED